MNRQFNLVQVIIFISFILIGAICFAKELSYERLIVAININYKDTGILSTILQSNDGNILIPINDLKQFKINNNLLNKVSILVDNQEYINLNKIEQTKYKLDIQKLTLDIFLAPEILEKQHYNATQKLYETLAMDKSVSGAFLNYNLNIFNRSREKYLAGIQEFNYFSNKGTLLNNFFIKQRVTGPISNELTRLETNYTFDDEEKLARLRIGDSITKAADWSGSTRFLGFQYSTNFAVKPDLVTHPLIGFTGRATLPSTLDIYANSLHIYQTQLQTGDYDIINLPVTSGNGNLVLKTRDITGKLETITLPYYVAPTLLSAGLSDFSFDMGIQRKDYATKSNLYKSFVANIDYKYGFTDYWTSSLHFEGIKKISSVGLTNYFKIKNYGIITSSLATRAPKTANAQLASLGYNYQGQNYSFNTNLTVRKRRFYDTWTYYDFVDMSNTLPIKISSKPSLQTSIGYHKEGLGNAFLNLSSFVSYDNKRFEILSFSYDKSLTNNSNFRFNVGTNLKDKAKGAFVIFEFSIMLGKQNLSTSISRESNNTVKKINISSPVSTPLDWGYNANFARGKTYDYDVKFDYNQSKVNTSLYLRKYGRDSSQELDFMGALIAMDSSVLLTQPIHNSFGLAKVGDLKDIPIYNNNQLVGKTDTNGKLLIPNMISYYPSKISFDEKKLPLHANFTTNTLAHAPKWKSGVLIDFGVKKIKSLTMVLINNTGQALPLGSSVKINGLKQETFIGYNGQVYVQDILDTNLISGKACHNDNCCSFKTETDSKFNFGVLEMGKVICN